MAALLRGQDIPAGDGPYVSLASWILTIVGISLGLAVIVYGFGRFLFQGSRPALLIALAIVVAGPAEEAIKSVVAQGSGAPGNIDALRFLVDRLTSVIFLLCLVLAIHWSRPGGRSS